MTVEAPSPTKSPSILPSLQSKRRSKIIEDEVIGNVKEGTPVLLRKGPSEFLVNQSSEGSVKGTRHERSVVTGIKTVPESGN